uniref:Uncharacterized protein n=1 Tax=Solanum lycopersicum TaxID=4081 RepID=A0A3Q7GZ95_SOLLC
MSSSSGLENVHYEGSKLHVFEKICQNIVQPKKHISSRVVSTKSIETMTGGIFSKPRAQISNTFHAKSKMLNNCIQVYTPSRVRRKVVHLPVYADDYAFLNLLDISKREVDLFIQGVVPSEEIAS